MVNANTQTNQQDQASTQQCATTPEMSYWDIIVTECDMDLDFFDVAEVTRS